MTQQAMARRRCPCSPTRRPRQRTAPHQTAQRPQAQRAVPQASWRASLVGSCPPQELRRPDRSRSRPRSTSADFSHSKTNKDQAYKTNEDQVFKTNEDQVSGIFKHLGRSPHPNHHPIQTDLTNISLWASTQGRVHIII